MHAFLSLGDIQIISAWSLLSTGIDEPNKSKELAFFEQLLTTCATATAPVHVLVISHKNYDIQAALATAQKESMPVVMKIVKLAEIPTLDVLQCEISSLAGMVTEMVGKS